MKRIKELLPGRKKSPRDRVRANVESTRRSLRERAARKREERLRKSVAEVKRAAAEVKGQRRSKGSKKKAVAAAGTIGAAGAAGAYLLSRSRKEKTDTSDQGPADRATTENSPPPEVPKQPVAP